MANEYPVPPQNFGQFGNRQQTVQGAILASAATIAPDHLIHHVSGTAAISTITTPWDDFSGGPLILIADGLFSLATGGNILSAYQVEVANTVLVLIFDKINVKWTVMASYNPNTANGGGSGTTALRNARIRTTTVNVNLGATLLPAVPGLKWRLVDFTVIAIGGAATTLTALTILGTQAASPATLASIAQAALTQSTLLKPNSANVTMLADGASFIQNDVNTAITIAKTGSAMTVATNIDVIISAGLEP